MLDPKEPNIDDKIHDASENTDYNAQQDNEKPDTDDNSSPPDDGIDYTES